MKSLLTVLLLCLTPALPAVAQEWALGGYDAVSYTRVGRPVPGRSDIATMWKGQKWHFSSEENRARFEADPRAYAPAFGGLCPVALAEGRRVEGDPTHFVIIGKRLYLTRSDAAEQSILSAPQRILPAARQGWLRLKQAPAAVGME
ncbi:YHS domain-containing (seleno)protein [Paracoccus marinaquae]|uniref:YHS domain-containing protein n=1 Tax=Paracoccus marinaquae TaxID=2841926 RepID=A0ABS6ALG6_9RHOB|nr:YHS domain-containing (seleno)protein [Paracoccus marinaquae]MBU3031442.1 YHS domain-containing protein [Paracoccus marinaquae]